MRVAHGVGQCFVPRFDRYLPAIEYPLPPTCCNLCIIFGEVYCCIDDCAAVSPPLIGRWKHDWNLFGRMIIGLVSFVTFSWQASNKIRSQTSFYEHFFLLVNWVPRHLNISCLRRSHPVFASLSLPSLTFFPPFPVLTIHSPRYFTSALLFLPLPLFYFFFYFFFNISGSRAEYTPNLTDGCFVQY